MAADLHVEKLEYGIGCEFQPVVLSPGRISLKVRTPVSEPTTEGSGGRSRGRRLWRLVRHERAVDPQAPRRHDRGIAVGRLDDDRRPCRDDVRQAVTGLPGLSKLPVLGTLFRSRDFVRNETELVIIVTPYLTRPVARNRARQTGRQFQRPRATAPACSSAA
jgi:pilus assembly protein CpaC